jgi:hypothetical protein
MTIGVTRMAHRNDMTALFTPDIKQFVRPLPDAHANERRYWGAYPADELAYEKFIRWALALARHNQPASQFRGPPEHDGIQSDGRRPQKFTNGIIDWTSSSESASVLQGTTLGGWIDPDCAHVGGMSRVRNDTRVAIATEPAGVNLERREWSFITLDAPTWMTDASRRSEGLYPRLIRPVVELVGSRDDNLYGWLDLVFSFCAGKTVVYYSRYVPSVLIGRIAAAHAVRLTHRSMRVLPEALFARNAAYRSMHFSLEQWRALESRLAGAGLHAEAGMVRAHLAGD